MLQCIVSALTKVVQEFLGSVLSGFEVEELLVLVNELGVHCGVQELVVGQNVLEERDVGLEMERKKRRTCVSKNAELTKASFSQTHTQYMKASESRPQSCCRSVLQFNHLKKKTKTKAPAFLKKASRVRAQC